MLFAVLSGAAARGAEAVEWTRAAYYDARYPQAWSGSGESMRDALQAAGYEVLSADELKSWMDARIADGKYSVVVFCRDIPPDTVTETRDANCTLRKYLDAGGKIVVYADIPFWNQGHADGSTTNWQSAGATDILGIGPVAVWNTNNTVTITAAGEMWGLTQTWSSVRPHAASDVDIVLAMDNSGNAAAWVKHYVEGDWFRGFVRLRDVGGQPPVEDVIRVAEYTGNASNPRPADGAVGVSMALLQWDAGISVLWHDVYFGTTPELGQVDYKTQMLLQSTMYFHPAGLQPGMTYYWRIDEVEADGTVRKGDTWSFTATPQAAWAPEPADGARYIDAGAILKWSPGMNATKRDVYFGTDRAAVEAGTGDTAKGTQYGTTYTPAVLDQGVTYYWRVDEVAGAGTATGDVWSFTVRPVIPKVDPTLVGWWKLEDEKSGTVVDYSGSDYYGELRGDPQWVEGYYGDALDFDGIDDFVNIPGPPDWPSGTEARSLCGWGKTDSVAGGYRWIAAFGSPGAGTAMFIGMNGTRLYGGGYGSDEIDVWVEGFWKVDVWHHICVTYDGTMGRLYADGLEVASGPRTWDLVPGLAHIGRQVNSYAEFWDGMIDDVRVYNKALTPDEIKDIIRRSDPLIAWTPQPKRGANVDIRDAVELSWSAGDTAARHDVYFGTDRDAVKAADIGSAEYQGRQDAMSFSLAGLVDFGGGAYFWRVDEVETDGVTVHRGSIWGFTVPDYLIADEFEIYTNDYEAGEAIWQAWIDGLTNGTGSIVGYFNPPFAEQTIVHSGAQSMPFDYNNVNSPYYSEAEKEWASPQDWTLYGGTDLSLWFRGNPVTAVETAAGQYRIGANSSDIWGAADNGRFMYKQLSGDGSISAKVLSVDNTSAWAKGGVMIRESLDPASSYAFMFPTPDGRRAFQNRPGTAANAVSAHSAVGAVTFPLWVKVERQGSQFTAYYSENGTSWIQQPDTENTGGDASANPQTIIMANTVYIGLALTSNNGRGGVCYAEFSEVNATGLVSGQWKIADIGNVARGNDPAPFYLAVQDTSNKVGVLTHPDPAAVNLTDWTEWKIPLNQIPNANLTRVKKLYIGVGDLDNPTPDGSGLLFIDDIRVIGPADAIP
jgi:hypothetical protein